ncbi:MAG: AbrB/MazE/SpoVT family DNA-binding domain-containing protein [Clostridia bacterium]|nr:AbrB/MazE/SpoVT family DNA-binding domain-containing protein [Clostridia bacterium]
MTQIGIVRKIDSLGRVTLPKEFRRVFRLKQNDEIEILATDEGILLRIPNIEVRRISTTK